MAADYYGADSGAPADETTASDESTMSTDQAAPEKEGGDEDSGESTALLPKSMFGGDCKVGDTYTVKVVHVWDNELEVEPVESGGEEASSEEAPMAAAESMMANYAKS